MGVWVCGGVSSGERREDDITLYLNRSTSGFVGFVRCAVEMRVSKYCWWDVSKVKLEVC